MPEDTLREIESHLEKVEDCSDDSEVSYHLHSAQQLIDVAMHKIETPREGDRTAPSSIDD